jgi:hypothetical protein
MKRTLTPVTFLMIIVLFSMLYNGIRIYSILSYWETLTNYDSHPEPLYMVISSGFWFVIGMLLMIGIIRRFSRTPFFIYISVIAGISWFWIDRIFLQKRFTAFLFPTIESLLTLSIIFLILINQDTKNYFREQARHD